MYIRHVERLSQEQLFEELREVRCMGNNVHVRPYRDAHFEIQMAEPGDFQPSALYVLSLELSFLSLLMDQLADHVGGIENIDTLLEYEDEYKRVTRMIPPVVELTDFGQWMISVQYLTTSIILTERIMIRFAARGWGPASGG